MKPVSRNMTLLTSLVFTCLSFVNVLSQPPDRSLSPYFQSSPSLFPVDGIDEVTNDVINDDLQNTFYLFYLEDRLQQQFDSDSDDFPTSEYIFKDPIISVPRAKRVHVATKRVYRCALLRRLGIPIDACFNRIVSRKPVVRQRQHIVDGYKYLEKQWPTHALLGGGVGR